MITHPLPLGTAGATPGSAWRRFHSASPAPAWAGAAFRAVSVLLLVPMAFDARQWQGVNT